MRRVIVSVVVVVAAAIAVAAGVVGYAFYNLSSIVERNRTRIVARASATLKRKVEVARIEARAGWGVSVAITGLRISDDPAFSEKPFVSSDQASVELEFLPLLRGIARVSRLMLIKPQIRVIQSRSGDFNVGTIGIEPGDRVRKRAPSTRAQQGNALAGLTIKELTATGALIFFNDRSQQAKPIQLRDLDFDISNFSSNAPFDLAMKFAFPGKERNASVTGRIGPLARKGLLDTDQAPVDLKFDFTSVDYGKLRKLTDIGSDLPDDLSIANPFSVSGTVGGVLGSIRIAASADFTANQVAYGGQFAKPAGTPMSASGNLTLRGSNLAIETGHLKLNDLELAVSKISLAENAISAQIDSNRFDLARLAPMVPPIVSLKPNGNCEFHGALSAGANVPTRISGVATLKQAGFMPSAAMAHGISALNGTVHFTDEGETLDSIDFAIGSSRANLAARIDSIDPPSAKFTLKSDSLSLHDIVSSRSPGEALNRLVVTGAVDGALAAPRVSAQISSGEGILANAPFRNLNLTAAYLSRKVSARPFSAQMFGGAISGKADAAFDKTARINLELSLKNVDVEQALRSQQIDAAKTVRGLLTGDTLVSGNGSSWKEIEPTLNGSGRATLVNGKLLGVNIVADAINAVAAAPGVSQIVDVAFMSSHHGLLVDPDTELQSASLSFQLSGPRFTTHDLTVRSPDYGIAGDGWFDLDKNISMNCDIQLSLGMRVAIPVLVSGRLPAVLVLPNIPRLAERIAMGAVNTPGRIIRGGVNAVGSLVGRGSSNPTAPDSSSPLSHPIDSLRKLLP